MVLIAILSLLQLLCLANAFIVSRPFSRLALARLSASSPTASGPGEVFVPDMSRRETMNNLLLGAVGVSTIGLAVPYLAFFAPPATDGGEGGIIARDAEGFDVSVSAWKANHNPESRELVQGLRGDATYLILDDKKNLGSFALNAICTHLGCVVPWNKAQNKFICPCHGSQYNPEGTVVRGPAPLPLALAHVEETSYGKVMLKKWTETDFRSGEDPWWT